MLTSKCGLTTFWPGPIKGLIRDGVIVRFSRPSCPANVGPYHRLSTVEVTLTLVGRVSLEEFRLCLLRAEDMFSFARFPGDYTFSFAPDGKLTQELYVYDLETKVRAARTKAA